MQNAQLTRVGLITDIHYDGSAIALNRLYEKISALNTGHVETLVVMGDVVNGANISHTKRMLREVSALCDSFKGTVHFMHGNHDLDYLSKAEFYTALGCAGNPSRFHFEAGGYNFICIDGNFSPDGTAYCAGNFNWQESYIAEEQLDWLRGQLAASLLPVIILSHQRIDKETQFAVRNYDQVRNMITLSDKVKAVFQGHNHEDDLLQVDGATYYTLSAHVDDAGPAVLELTSKGVRLLRDFQPLETA
ncbi:metallophosphoesterase [Pontiellaceae bacterium B1224]|nr:metallophosphoesterase [Pontiellaceae bacterium B1224]